MDTRAGFTYTILKPTAKGGQRILKTLFGFLVPQDKARTMGLHAGLTRFLRNDKGCNKHIWWPLFQSLSRAYSDWVGENNLQWMSEDLNPRHGCVWCNNAMRQKFRILVPGGGYICPGCEPGYDAFHANPKNVYKTICEWLKDSNPLSKEADSIGDQPIGDGWILTLSLANWVKRGSGDY